MAILVHLTSEKNVKSVRRSGLKARVRGSIRGVFCLPVLPNYFVSHQWLRELKRSGQRTIVAIDFRLANDEEVYVGHYGCERKRMSVGEAIGVIRSQSDARGYEVIVPRSISPKEIHRVRSISQVVGWRYSPDAHTQPPECGCRACIPRGSIKSTKLRSRLNSSPEKRSTDMRLLAELRSEKNPDRIVELLARCPISKRTKSDGLAFLMDHPSVKVLEMLAFVLDRYRDPGAVQKLPILAKKPYPSLQSIVEELLLEKKIAVGKISS